MTTTLIETHKAFGGEQRKYRHYSETLDCDMVFSLFLPQQTDNKTTTSAKKAPSKNTQTSTTWRSSCPTPPHAERLWRMMKVGT